MQKDYKSQQGLSLVELMISITLGLVLMAGVIQVFLSSREVFSTQQAMSRAQENGRLGMELLSEDIRMAGFWGCANRDSPMETDLLVGFWNDYVSGGQPNAIQGMAAGDIAGLGRAPIANSPALVLRYAFGDSQLLTSENDINTVSVAGSVADGCIGGVCENKPAIISNCVAGRVFIPTAISAAGTGSAVIEHAGQWDSSIIANIHEIFYPGAEVIPVNTIVFYLANNPAGRPSLYRHESLSGQAIEIIEGVERINFQFGINGNYVAFGAVANWLDVTGVRVEMLVQGGDQNVLKDEHSYFFAGENITPAEPKRLYQVFASTVAIRSRAN